MTKQSTNESSTSSFSQPWLEGFDEIRGYFDEEVGSSVTRLCTNDSFLALLMEFFALSQPSATRHEISQVVTKTVSDLQGANSIDKLQLLVRDIASPIVEMSVSNMTFSGLDRLPADQNYLFISNHRDILMDPLLLNLLLDQHQHKTAHCAIGDNLLQNNIAVEFALLNKCFRVLRSLTSPRAILKAMKLQSAYIRYLSHNRRDNIWIAQKEGRSKDNLDKTNPALIKMLGLAKPKETAFGEYITRLNIVPVSFSYEWDPCDIDKATELEITEQQGHYQKKAVEDLTAVKKGLLQPKGSVHIHFDNELLEGDIERLNHLDIAERIDQSIARHSKIYPVNFSAAKALDAVLLKEPESLSLSQARIDQATAQLDRRLRECTNEIRNRVLLNYAAPLMRR